MRQDMGHISGDIGSGGERNLFIAIATNGYFPTSDIEVIDPLEVSSAGWNSPEKEVCQETYDFQAKSAHGPV
jgi:hypothetical protein